MVYRSDLPHSPVIKRSIAIGGRQTSVSLEDPFWQLLKDVATTRCMSVSALVSEIDDQRQRRNLSAALRLFVLRSVGGERHGR
jgi:predicted DNA-binding ribbon-helix-helix protein